VDDATPEEVQEAIALVDSGKVTYGRCSSPEKLYIEVTLTSTTGHSSKAVIAGSHTNLCYLEKDGSVLLDKPLGEDNGEGSESALAGSLSVQAIYDFVESIDREKDDLHMIEQAITVNSAISKVAETGDYGLNIGRQIRENLNKAFMGNSVVDQAVADTAGGSDARMAGANVPVVTNSGSGNQGITATVPILSVARNCNMDEDRTFRAVALSNLIAIYIHSGFGLLSGLCGATIASTGASCGIVYLLGGGVKEIEGAINNMLGNVTGMLCDGAKADCALKISTCTYAAFTAAFMALRGVVVQPSDGIVETDPAKTIENFTLLGNEGSPKMDEIVLDVLLSKKYA